MSQVSSPNIMFVFPGQGSQYVGMGSDIHRRFSCVRDLYERASQAMGFDVAELSFQGPEERLNGTEFTQIALLTHSIACLAAFRELTGEAWTPNVLAGHSLGEYSALVAAGVLAFEDALRLIRMRGRLMSEFGRGRMAAFRFDLDSIRPLAEARYCGIGGCNLPDQTVVCGFERDLEALMEDVAARFGRSRAGRYLKTEGAFHTYLMIGAAERYRPHLDAAALAAPRARVLSNYTGDYHADDPEQMRAALFFQMFHPVKWMGGLRRAIDDGVNLVVEFGGGIGRDQPGRVHAPESRKPNLEGIMRKAYAASGRRGLYLPAINRATLERAARTLELLRSASPMEPVWVDERHFSLHLPLHQGAVDEDSLGLGRLVQELGLRRIVETEIEEDDDSLLTLKTYCDEGIASAEPYLEVVVGGETGAFLHYRGDAIRHELAALHARLERPAPAIRAAVGGGLAG
ncbi:ACP S-malonyltransferase [Azotobacter vinelandii]|uniref:ACP S-malonyltransferase n=1 Tax=Azotobacter vinelandii TaxID=354 RepID=UPI002665CB06|nr:ACP S-malonyltransferase [Azotobacter vinelandii]WKN20088.1 ACP S-malonyltransferase [Azotobacter vinelandii]